MSVRRAFARAGLGALALAGASACSSDECIECEWPAEVSGNILIHNANEHDIAIWVRPLRSDLWPPCEIIAQDPAQLLADAAFADALHWTLPRSTNLALSGELFAAYFEGGPRCFAALVGGEGLATQLLWSDDWYWDEGWYLPGATIPDFVARIVFDDRGVGRWVGGEDIRFDPPNERPNDAPEHDPACALVDDRIEWALPGSGGGDYVVLEVEYGLDGCFAIELGDPSSTASETAYLCAPQHAFPFAVGDHIQLYAHSSSYESTQSLHISLLDPVTHALTPDRVSYLRDLDLYLTGYLWEPPLDVFGLRGIPRDECAWRVEQCATIERPLDVLVRELDVVVRVGDPPVVVESDGYSSSLTLVHARERALVDGECGSNGIQELDVVVVRSGG